MPVRARKSAEARCESDEAAGVRIVLADDHAVVRSGLRMLLEREPGFEVVAEAPDIATARRYLLGHRPDVLLVDLNMPGGSTLKALPRLTRDFPDTAVVVLTMQQEPAFAREALAAGAIGYVVKDAADDELVRAVRYAAAGERYVNPRMGERMAVAPPADAPDGLSPRDADILRLIALGHTNAEMAQQLFLSVRTVETHRARIQHELGTTTRSELVSYALDNGLISA